MADSKPLPRIRVRARLSQMIKVGGVGVMVDGFYPSLSSALRAVIGNGRLHKLEYAGYSGDYDKYRVIYD